ncbi:MAG TPA: phosphatase domain-containing protein [Thermoanaerobaculia bacterium]|nr:phosphatase domain-containing protein [Thermoanaerobaculia bacterium]
MSWRSALRSVAFDVEDAFDRRWDALRIRHGLGEPLRIVPYRGYRTTGQAILRGRVLERKHHQPPEDRDSVWDNLARWWDRVDSDEVAGARITARFEGREQEVVSDDEGFFHLEMETGGPGRGDELAFHEVDLELLEPLIDGEGASARGELLVPGAGAAFGWISDLDDTIIRTGATSTLRMARVIFLNNARSRAPFPGVAAFYRALARGGPGGAAVNPVFYVSSSPWNYYSLFAHYLDLHDFPAGPVFLKDFGLTKDHFVKSGHEDYKVERITRVLDAYPELPFLLVGDSGQHDPETYRRVIAERPGRILAAYLRDVTPEGRDREVHAISDQVAGAGIDMVLAEDTTAAARHAVEHGWIAAGAVEEIAAEVEREAEGSGEVLGGPLDRLLGRD